MKHEDLIEEIKRLPEEKLTEIYDLVHYYRIGLEHDPSIAGAKKERPIGLAKGRFTVPNTFFEPLPPDLLDIFEGR